MTRTPVTRRALAIVRKAAEAEAPAVDAKRPFAVDAGRLQEAAVKRRTAAERNRSVEEKRPRAVDLEIVVTDGAGPIPEGALELFARWVARGRAKRGGSDA